MPHFVLLEATFIERRSNASGDAEWYEVDGKTCGINRWRAISDTAA
ncbi:hypothetical protein ACTGJ9_018500 [Bradyrhizobium sp. RDM12]